jgi:hypothetical protein
VSGSITGSPSGPTAAPGSVVSGTGDPSGSVRPGTNGPEGGGKVVVVVPAAAISAGLRPEGEVLVGTESSAPDADITLTATV